MARIRRDKRSERGATAVLFAMLTVVLLGFAAFGVDVAQQVSRKHLLISQLDAAATAGAYQLGNGGGISGAVTSAQSYFTQNGSGAIDPSNVDFWCVIARKLDGNNQPLNPAMAADYQIPTRATGSGVCNPDAVSASTIWRQSEYQNRVRGWDGRQFSMTCSQTLCAVPCALNAGPGNNWNAGTSVYNNREIQCNTMRVGAEEDVPFSFAPVLGVDEGSTGSQVSVACAGSCGEVAPNPLDVVVVADRTLSMSANRDDLVDGIESMLQVMTPEQQYVALGAIGPSTRTRTNSENYSCNSSWGGLVYPSSNPSTASTGSWIPISFKKDYLGSADSNGVRRLNTSSKLTQAVDCLDSTAGDSNLGRTGTELAAPLKQAARYVLGKSGDENNIAALGGASRSGEVQQVIIFETDGEPQEPADTTTTPITLDNRNEIFSSHLDYTSATTSNTTTSGTTAGRPSGVSRPSQCPNGSNGSSNTYACTYEYFTRTTTETTVNTYTGGQQACENFKEVARLAKREGILIITIGYGIDGKRCGDGNNYRSLPSGSDNTSTTEWISNISPSSCRASGSGTESNPYVPRSDCRKTITWTVRKERDIVTSQQHSNNPLVSDVLAEVSGGTDQAVGSSNGCLNDASTAAENSDEDLFFCAARGDDLAPLFVTALGSVTGGVKLIKLP